MPCFAAVCSPLLRGCPARQVEKNKERLKLEQGDDKVKDNQIAMLIDMERVVSLLRVRGRVVVMGRGVFWSKPFAEREQRHS